MGTSTNHPLTELLKHVAQGRFPPSDGTVKVLPSPPGPVDAVLAFTTHHVVATDVDPSTVLAQLPPGDLGAPLRPAFLTWLGQAIGSEPGCVDAVMVALGTGALTDTCASELLRRDDLFDHPRVVPAARYRRNLAVYSDPHERSVVILGDGLAGRREVSFEVDTAHRNRGLGRELLRAAIDMCPRGEALFAQVTPGNAASVRAALAAGFHPVGAEVLFLKGERGDRE